MTTSPTSLLLHQLHTITAILDRFDQDDPNVAEVRALVRDAIGNAGIYDVIAQQVERNAARLAEIAEGNRKAAARQAEIAEDHRKIRVLHEANEQSITRLEAGRSSTSLDPDDPAAREALDYYRDRFGVDVREALPPQMWRVIDLGGGRAEVLLTEQGIRALDMLTGEAPS